MLLATLASILLIAHAQAEMKPRHIMPGYSVGDIKLRLQVLTPPMPGVNNDATLGPWFVQFRKAPCTWPGSDDFTDFQVFFKREGNSNLCTEVWRDEFCTRTTTRWIITGPGAYAVKDALGNNMNGKMVTAAADYNNYIIFWGCTKISITGTRCDDPWISICTRERFPRPEVLTIIDGALRKLWSVTIGELRKLKHGMPCTSPIQGKQYMVGK